MKKLLIDMEAGSQLLAFCYDFEQDGGQEAQPFYNKLIEIEFEQRSDNIIQVLNIFLHQLNRFFQNISSLSDLFKSIILILIDL